MNRRGLFALLVVVALAVGIFFLLRGGPPRTDEEQIHDLLTEGKRAVEEKDLSGLMRLVSKDFKMSELNRDRLRFAVGQGFRDTSSIYVALNNVSVQTHGETATVSANVTLESRGKSSDSASSNTYPVTFELKREPGQRYLVIPIQVWRVVEASGPGLNIGSDLFGI